MNRNIGLEGKVMTEQYRVVKVSYSEELSSESELWFRRFIEKTLLDHITKNDERIRALLIGEK
jgi:hypothetical protein